MSLASPLVDSKNYSLHWDVLRGFSILIMMFVHTPAAMMYRTDLSIPIMSVSAPCIGLIFMLSGFLITRSSCRQIFAENGPTKKVMKIFALRRMLRTWPLYYLFVIVCFLIPVSLFTPIAQPIWSYLTFTFPITKTIVQSNGDVRLLHLWSTCLEEWCYFLFLFTIPFIRKHYVNYIFIILAIAPVAGRYVLSERFIGTMTDADYLVFIHSSIFYRWDEFWWGCLLGRWSYLNGEPNKKTQTVFLLAAVMISVFYIFAYFFVHDATQDIRILFNPTIGALVSALLIMGIKVIPGHWIKWTGLHAIGLRTYTIYLVHFIVMEIFVYISRNYGILPVRTVYEIIGAYAFTILVSFGLFEIFEKPILTILKTKLKFSSKAAA